jgi:hypothetical protein
MTHAAADEPSPLATVRWNWGELNVAGAALSEAIAPRVLSGAEIPVAYSAAM